MAMGFLTVVSRMANGLLGPREPKGERLFPCSLWIAAHDAGNVKKATSVFLETLQRKMDSGMVPGTFDEAVLDGGFGEGLGTDLDVFGRMTLDSLPAATKGMPMPFPVWMALEFGGALEMVCGLKITQGMAGATIREAFVLSARRNEAELVAWRPFLSAFARDLMDVSLVVSAAGRLNSGLLPSGAETAKVRHRTV